MKDAHVSNKLFTRITRDRLYFVKYIPSELGYSKNCKHKCTSYNECTG